MDTGEKDPLLRRRSLHQASSKSSLYAKHQRAASSLLRKGDRKNHESARALSGMSGAEAMSYHPMRKHGKKGARMQDFSVLKSGPLVTTSSNWLMFEFYAKI